MQYTVTKAHPGIVAYAMHYVDNNDYPHRRSHIIEVATNARKIARRYGMPLLEMELASLLHDIYSFRDRERHHILAANWAEENLPKFGYDKTVVKNVMDMCRCHRASGIGYEEELAMAFSAADRGPLSVAGSLVRSLGYFQDYKEPPIEKIQKLITHLRKKFGRNGYAQPNRIHAEFFGEQNENFVRQISSDMSNVLDIWESVTKPAMHKPTNIAVISDVFEEYRTIHYLNEEQMIALRFPIVDAETAPVKFNEFECLSVII